MKKMLIDAAHAEETRVAVVDGTRVEEFDFESRAKKQLRGNIYLAKVTRVEPSLQAAFIEYGGNRHGFLAFNEIHPDYYQIPHADREALLREEAEDNERHGKGGNGHHHAEGDADHEGDEIEADEDDELDEEVERRRRRLMRRYKIQEVIKRRQIMLVQVVKDERGGKGASLTTYLSLAGRYCVLMPNTARGGGVSRKIVSGGDRKRLKDIINGLDVPEGMGLIVRTAGAKRTKAEIKRDYEYLMRLWENIRNTTLHSIAPALIYEEEDLVKRAIRDMYDKDIDLVEVEGEHGYREARDFMRMLMPSQAKKVQPYREATPLFVKHRIEDNLAQIYSPVVPLRSGGYLVINQTEALVAIDVNSGKATKERNIESTALKTNLEAAEEAARQLRLRDLAGLIVIDFIDMEEGKNNRAVEKRLKEGLDEDRARIQMGRISTFGLMELSRQRRRTGVLEGTTHVCQHCHGSGRVLSVESSALAALRAVENEAARNGPGTVELKLPRDVALYVLNEKRAYLARLQAHSQLYLCITIDESIGHAEHEIERTSDEPRVDDLTSALLAPPEYAPEPEDLADETYEDEDEEDLDEDEDEDEDAVAAAESDEGEGRLQEVGGRSRRRRRRRGGRREDQVETRAPLPAESEAEAEGDEDEGDEDEDVAEAGGAPRAYEEGDSRHRSRRRRGRRGSRRPREESASSDVYGWTKARTPDGSDPYGWYDTAPPVDLNAENPPPQLEAAQPSTPVAAQPAAPSVEARSDETQPMQTAAPASDGSDQDIWVELPAPAEPRSRSRRSRGRSRSESAAAPQSASADAVATGQAEEVVEARSEDSAGVSGDASASEPAQPEASPVETPPESAVEAPKPSRSRRSRSSAKLTPAGGVEPAESDATPTASGDTSEHGEAPVPFATMAAGINAAVANELVSTPASDSEPAAPAAETTVPPQPEAAAERQPDPNEIVAPPAQPKRGWWRRG